MMELLRRTEYGGMPYATVASIGLFIVFERITGQEDLPYGRDKYSYPIMNVSWCDDLPECCPIEFRSDDKFTKMLTDFCFDDTYGFVGVKAAGIDEEKERAEFTGMRKYTNSQIDRLAGSVLDALAENSDTKKAFLNDPLFYCPYLDADRCYWKVHKIFSLLCLDPVYNRHARLYKHVFVHACEANWLDLRKIANITKETCAKREDIMMGHETPAPRISTISNSSIEARITDTEGTG